MTSARMVGEMILVAAQAAQIDKHFAIVICSGDEETALAHKLCTEGTLDGYITLSNAGTNVEILSFARTAELDRKLGDLCDSVAAKLVGFRIPSRIVAKGGAA